MIFSELSIEFKVCLDSPNKEVSAISEIKDCKPVYHTQATF